MEKISFISELKDRLRTPWNWSFFGYLFIVLFFGGIGIAFEAYEAYYSVNDDGYKIAQSISIFFIAVLATSFVDLNLSPKIYNKISFLIYSFIFYGFGVLLLFLSYQKKTDISFIPATMGLILTIFVWVLANADDKKFDEENFSERIKKPSSEHGSNW